MKCLRPVSHFFEFTDSDPELTKIRNTLNDCIVKIIKKFIDVKLRSIYKNIFYINGNLLHKLYFIFITYIGFDLLLTSTHDTFLNCFNFELNFIF